MRSHMTASVFRGLLFANPYGLPTSTILGTTCISSLHYTSAQFRLLVKENIWLSKKDEIPDLDLRAGYAFNCTTQRVKLD